MYIIIYDTDEGGLSVTEYSMIAEFAAGYLTNHMISTVGGISNLNCRVLLPISYSHAQSTRYKVCTYFMLLHYFTTIIDN